MRKTMVVTVMGVLLTGIPALAQMHQGHGQGMGEKGEMAEKCQQMMAKHQAMQQEMAETNARIQELQQKMQTAEGEAKVAAMADLLNALASHHLAMQQRMSTMMPEMMEHMSEHMAEGMAQSMKESMHGCMMMKKGMTPAGEAKTPTEKKDGGHAGHH